MNQIPFYTNDYEVQLQSEWMLDKQIPKGITLWNWIKLCILIYKTNAGQYINSQNIYS